MKTFFTLLFTTAMLSTAFAQYSQRDDRDRTKENDVYVSNDNRGYDKYDYDDKGFDKHNKDYKGRYFFTPRERDMQISQINREYNYRIQSVQNKYFMSWYQKKRLINNLEVQRDDEIHEVIHKFNDSRNQFGDRCRKEKRNRW